MSKYEHLVTATRKKTGSKVQWCVLLDDTAASQAKANKIVKSFGWKWLVHVHPASEAQELLTKDSLKNLQYWERESDSIQVWVVEKEEGHSLKFWSSDQTSRRSRQAGPPRSTGQVSRKTY